jgi:hypothetical protein
MHSAQMQKHHGGVTMLRKLLVLGVIAAIAAISMASAASLGTVAADQIGAGDAVVTSCDTSGVDIAWRTQVQDNPPGFQVIAVELSNIDVACAGQYVLLSISKGGHHWMMGRQAAAISGTTAVVDQWYVGGGWTGGTGPMAIDIDDVHVVIKQHRVAYDG